MSNCFLRGVSAVRFFCLFVCFGLSVVVVILRGFFKERLENLGVQIVTFHYLAMFFIVPILLLCS